MGTVHIADQFGHQAPRPAAGPAQEPPAEPGPALRTLILTPASTIKPRRVRWLWDKRVAYGTLALLAGREGLGKSTLAYHLAAEVTQGTLEGEDLGTPRSVLVAASEDSWEHTIVPRLIAARADLDRIYRVEIETWSPEGDGPHISLSLPRDYRQVEEAAALVDAGLMILDPLMSVIDSRLDTHRDREVRTALEPLAALADTARMAIIGLIHHNKSGSTDALQLVMGSKAFAAVARSVHTCIPDPDDETQERRIFATSKNNLGRTDLPVLGFTISSHAVETDDDGTAWTGRLNWTGEIAGSMHEIMTRTADPERTATAEAADWLHDYLASHGGEASKVDIEKAGRVAGHSATALRRARERLRLEYRSHGFPRQTLWSLPGAVDTTADDAASRVDITEPLHEPASHVTSHVTVTSPPDTTDTTGPDLHKHQNDQPDLFTRAHARAGGDDTTDTTGKKTRLHNPSRASHASHVRPPRAGASAGDDIPTLLAAHPPSCDDCGHPIDSPEHERICEDQP